MSNYETITVEKRDKVALITINRPDKLNALSSKVHEEGVAALDDLRKRRLCSRRRHHRNRRKIFYRRRGHFRIRGQNSGDSAQQFF